MKKIISMILVCTLMASMVNVSFSAEVEKGDITSYGISTTGDTGKTDVVLNNDNIFDVNVAPE